MNVRDFVSGVFNREPDSEWSRLDKDSRLPHTGASYSELRSSLIGSAMFWNVFYNNIRSLFEQHGDREDIFVLIKILH